MDPYIRQDGDIKTLDAVSKSLNLARDVSDIASAKAAFDSVSVLLTTIGDSIFTSWFRNTTIDSMFRDSTINRNVELGLACADICVVLDQGSSGKLLKDLNNSVCEAIDQLKTTAMEIQRKVIEQGERNVVSRFIHSENDKEAITTWKLNLDKILHVFNTELATITDVADTHTIMHDVYRMMGIEEWTEGEGWSTHTRSAISTGEPPPPPPRTFFGHKELIDKIVGRAKNFLPFALIGTGGIGKTSIALTVLHHYRIKQRFGDNRHFIRCDQFPTSLAHFLGRLSKAIGAGVKTPENLAPLRQFLSSRDFFLVLDNAESILDPQGKDAQEIYAVVEELSRFSNICLCVTSRISVIPPACESLEIPALSMEAARKTFYHTYNYGNTRHPDPVNSVLEQLNYHPLSIVLLATVAHHNEWDTGRLSREWARHRADHPSRDKTLATAIELSLASPMFRGLGPDARELLRVVAFFPQGVSENNLDRLFPTISDRRNIFDKFDTLSLTYRNNGFIKMLAPLRDYFSPKDPASSSLLRITKECYFSRLSVRVGPGEPNFEARWIISEGVNIEHLLCVFTPIDVSSGDVWDACANFVRHLHWHKPWLVILGRKIEELPDHHPSKPQYLFRLAQLLGPVANAEEEHRRVLLYALRLWRERGDDFEVARTLTRLAHPKWRLGNRAEGIPLVKIASEIFERLNHTAEHAQSLQCLAWLLRLESSSAAEEAASRSLNLLLDNKDDEFFVCECHRTLGDLFRHSGKIGEAKDHFSIALKIASSHGWQDQQFWIHHSLGGMFFGARRSSDARVHAERALVYAVNDAYLLSHAMNLRAIVLHSQRRFEEATSEALRAADVHEKLGDTLGLDISLDYLDLIKRVEYNLAHNNAWVSPARAPDTGRDLEMLTTALLPVVVILASYILPSAS